MLRVFLFLPWNDLIEALNSRASIDFLTAISELNNDIREYNNIFSKLWDFLKFVVVYREESFYFHAPNFSFPIYEIFPGVDTTIAHNAESYGNIIRELYPILGDLKVQSIKIEGSFEKLQAAVERIKAINELPINYPFDDHGYLDYVQKCKEIASEIGSEFTKLVVHDKPHPPDPSRIPYRTRHLY